MKQAMTYLLYSNEDAFNDPVARFHLGNGATLEDKLKCDIPKVYISIKRHDG